MPFIGASNVNNGLTNFIRQKKNTPNSIYKNVISVNRTGSVGYAFYHPYNACFQGDVRVLLRERLSTNIALFVCTCIRQQRYQFNYGFKLGTERLKELKINLPINDNGNPNWTFMNDYMNKIKSKIPTSYVHDKIHHSKYSLENRNWKQFKIRDIGTILSSKDYAKKDRHYGSLPYIGRTRYNNGITNFIANTNNTPDTIYRNVIAVNRNGSTGYAFYHQYRAYFSGGVRVIRIEHLNKAIGLFISTCIHQQRYQFSYGFELGRKRLMDLKINLPVDSNEHPDWEFMQKYIESMIK